MVRVGDSYYMTSTTMHLNPGVPIMKSKDLSNWEIVNYAYDILGNQDETMLLNGKNTYGKGSWASCIRYVNGKFFVKFRADETLHDALDILGNLSQRFTYREEGDTIYLSPTK